ncbi:hypothetical protein Y032_0236g3213 [Ancylostoma ceylanicum]|uniref:Uncharacterized protein n=1 Tax=Ancylostoma ceylanicum TaxID=53326 RepID=A0A016SFN5_9BILA|nr:hypothetical protein Y032_0236g3213 [Ancylostoma ceylanicum]
MNMQRNSEASITNVQLKVLKIFLQTRCLWQDIHWWVFNGAVLKGSVSARHNSISSEHVRAAEHIDVL